MSTERDLDRLVRELNGRTPLRASALLFTIFAVIAAVFIWAWATEIDDVTRAPGRVVPAGDVQRVQAAEAGVIYHVAWVASNKRGFSKVSCFVYDKSSEKGSIGHVGNLSSFIFCS